VQSLVVHERRNKTPAPAQPWPRHGPPTAPPDRWQQLSPRTSCSLPPTSPLYPSTGHEGERRSWPPRRRGGGWDGTRDGDGSALGMLSGKQKSSWKRLLCPCPSGPALGAPCPGACSRGEAGASWPPGSPGPSVTPREQGDVGRCGARVGCPSPDPSVTPREQGDVGRCGARVGCPSPDPTSVPFKLLSSVGADPSQARQQQTPLPSGEPLPLSLPPVISNKPELCAGPALLPPEAAMGGSEQAASRDGAGAGAAGWFLWLFGGNFFHFESALRSAAACPICRWSPSKHSKPRAPRRLLRRAGGGEWAAGGCGTRARICP